MIDNKKEIRSPARVSLRCRQFYATDVTTIICIGFISGPNRIKKFEKKKIQKRFAEVSVHPCRLVWSCRDIPQNWGWSCRRPRKRRTKVKMRVLMDKRFDLVTPPAQQQPPILLDPVRSFSDPTQYGDVQNHVAFDRVDWTNGPPRRYRAIRKFFAPVFPFILRWKRKIWYENFKPLVPAATTSCYPKWVLTG